jgi:hypothetical protein
MIMNKTFINSKGQLAIISLQTKLLISVVLRKLFKNNRNHQWIPLE